MHFNLCLSLNLTTSLTLRARNCKAGCNEGKKNMRLQFSYKNDCWGCNFSESEWAQWAKTMEHTTRIN